MYENGEGVAKDYHESEKWYRRAAERGHVYAQVKLGTQYLQGNGVPQDYAEALKWLRLAADQGNPLAQAKLGEMYLDGKGVPQDYVLAHMWFTLAAAKGQQDAASLRDALAKRMTPAQIAEAQKLAREWTPKRSLPPS
jgi:TPR repeat protein